MTIKNAIAIGKGLGLLVKVEENKGDAATFRSFLRLLVSIDVSKPLNLGFYFTRIDGSSTWVSLKYERLDVYCIDCGKIGHKQLSCLALQVDKFPSRCLIYLKVNVFSNLLSATPVNNLLDSHQTPSSSQRNKPNTPCIISTQPHANQTNILTSSQNSLTPQTPALWSQNPKLTTSLAQVTSCPIFPSAANLENTIENTLNALSLFQKPIQLFSTNLSPSTSLSNPNSFLNPNKSFLAKAHY
jgi:hypothetical protein